MPELPDVEAYVEALRRVAVGHVLERVRVASPIILRTVDPPLAAVEGKRITGVRRIGKRIVLELEGDLFLVVHLMIAGRFHWKPRGAAVPARVGHAALDLDSGTLMLTEANATKRASLHLVCGAAALEPFARGGIEPLDADRDAFRDALMRESHTLKRALTDPGIFSGIGNAYSDEILHTAKLSPFKLAANLTDDEVSRLYSATQSILTDAVTRSVGQRAATLKGEKRSGLQVHARSGLPCPVCGDTVRSVSFADRSFQYCPTCQTEGRELADRRLSKLLK